MPGHELAEFPDDAEAHGGLGRHEARPLTPDDLRHDPGLAIGGTGDLGLLRLCGVGFDLLLVRSELLFLDLLRPLHG